MKTQTQLIEDVVRAKVLLEELLPPPRAHAFPSCPVESDPEGYAPCNCGADAFNKKREQVFKLLSID